MIKKIAFGECLKFFLTTLNIRMSQLSKSINVDNSLINHWVHGKRIPPYGSSYIENIAEFFSKNIYNSYQIRLLDDFFSNLYGDCPMPAHYKDKMIEVLLEAQGYSKECREQEYKLANRTPKDKIKLPSNKMNNNSDSSSKSNLCNITFPSSKDFSASLVYGIDNIYNAGIALLKKAVEVEQGKNNVVYITYTNNYNLVIQPECNIFSIRDELLNLIKNHWKVVFLLRIDHNIDRIIKFIHYVLPLIKTGNVHLYYLNNYNTLTDREIYIISEVGVLSCFPTDLNSVINCGIYLKDKEAVTVYANYFNVLLGKHAKSLIKFYPEDIKENYYEAVIKAKEKIGRQLNYNCSFSMELITEDLYHKLLLKSGMSFCDVLKSVDFYKRQLNAIIVNLQGEKFLNIHFVEAMDSLFQTRYLYLYTYSGIEKVHLETMDLIEYYENIINFINTYDNYHVAIINHTNDKFDINNDIKFIIKDRQAVFLHAFDPLKKPTEIRLSIEEPVIVKAFMEYFNELWEHISPIDKDKKEITAFLQSYISILRCQAP
ncbi:MAG: helix-turn-helix transcriptional regulator [Anaerocolumna sp.]|jgi:hypothetical protein|nr:helix-turn-helix transcriptional regulator [Anaerocolumna sp.]